MGETSLKECTKQVLHRYFSEVDNVEEIRNLHQFLLDEVEQQLIIDTLKVVNGNKLKAAKILGINRNTLRSKINYFKLD